ncbi:hypothetical protein O6H91_14G022800 [Diphasiastrum complanatum]|uniref:Uncharacterized protein n=1 Tax=Diphasiastrum complanatum TaxID=34168 RepID=A0ACC2BM91_DIPCM|nr:hypothetical protein O6H91_14G022800 [Diphasiastrum complanatum]
MQSLQQQATGRSGVKEEDAFAIDEVNLYQKLGHQTFVNLSTEFYNRWVTFSTAPASCAHIYAHKATISHSMSRFSK